MNENPVALERVTNPAMSEQTRAHSEQLKRNLDWLNARWDDLLARDRGRYVAVAGQELFLADTYQKAMELARAAPPRR